MRGGTNELVSIVSATGEEKIHYQPKCVKPVLPLSSYYHVEGLPKCKKATKMKE